MSDRLHVSITEGWLTKEEATGARTIWHRGNKVIHEDPTVVKDAFGTIATTLAIASKLYRERTTTAGESEAPRGTAEA